MRRGWAPATHATRNTLPASPTLVQYGQAMTVLAYAHTPTHTHNTTRVEPTFLPSSRRLSRPLGERPPLSFISCA